MGFVLCNFVGGFVGCSLLGRWGVCFIVSWKGDLFCAICLCVWLALCNLLVGGVGGW